VKNELFLVVKYKFGVSIGGHSARGRPQAGRALSKARRLGLKMSGPASVPKRSDRPPGVCASIFLISTLACTIEHLSTSVVIYRPAS